MRKAATSLSLVLAVLLGSGVAEETAETELPRETVRLIAYASEEKSQAKHGARNAIGGPLRADPEYTSAAADWSIFPVGMEFRIVGKPTVYVIDDYGSGLIGKRIIDIHVLTISEMRKVNRRNVEIEIVKPGSYERALAILKRRLGNSHCKTMYDRIRKKLSR